MDYQTIDVRPLNTAIGAEIAGVDLSRPLDNRQSDEIHRAFNEYLVIFFRDQHLTPEQHKGFARRFGELNVHPHVKALDGHPEVIEVVKDVQDTRNFGGLWHIDLTFLERPSLGSMLYAREVPDYGGDTLWGNMYLAYETLSEGMRALLDPLVGIHSGIAVYGPKEITGRDREKKMSMRLAQTEEADDEVEHPLVRTHPETGRKSLFAGGSYLRRFKGMTEAESAPIVDFLRDHQRREEFTCRWRWQANDLAFWDNRCTTHYALNDYDGKRRLMHRVTVEGDRPV